MAWNHVGTSSLRWTRSLNRIMQYGRIVKFSSEYSRMATVPNMDNIESQSTCNDLENVCGEFQHSDVIKKAVMDLGIEERMYQHLSKGFCKMILSPRINKRLSAVLSDGYTADELFPYFIDFIKEKAPMLLVMRNLKLTSDLTDPRNWYPLAQELQRQFVLHVGPTNSGKTYHAHQQFLSAASGIYCSPLRMLANEVYAKTNLMGVCCDLITGEERLCGSGSENDPAHHIACTIEMANLNPSKPYDVAVIDEIQMIRDSERGGAWTRALLGVPARIVHVCGEPSCIPLMEELIGNNKGNNIEIKNYERLNPLKTLKRGLRGRYSNIKPGDCVVAFSRTKLFQIKHEIERSTDNTCAIIYGGLPAATRNSQSERFNSSNAKVLVASDAIGMGLNLNIKRIVFHSLMKYNGSNMEILTPSQTKQIGGRAGRYSLDHATGEVTTFHDKDLQLLHKLMTNPIQDIEKAGLTPSYEQIEVFSSFLPDYNLPRILSLFSETATVSNDFFLCKDAIRNQIILSKIISIYNLSLRDCFTLSLAPVNTKNDNSIVIYEKFIKLFSSGIPVTMVQLRDFIGWPIPRPRNHAQIIQLEEAHVILDLYHWLNQRYPDSFPMHEEIAELQTILEETIGVSLRARMRRTTALQGTQKLRTEKGGTQKGDRFGPKRDSIRKTVIVTKKPVETMRIKKPVVTRVIKNGNTITQN